MDILSSTAKANLPPTGPASTTPTAKSNLDYDSFLTLLVAQLKHQDPTDPQDMAQYMGQLAGFSNVEQSMKMNTKLDQLMATTALSQADSVIGHTVTSADGSVSGKATALKIGTDGPLAVLEDGRQILLGTGVTIS